METLVKAKQIGGSIGVIIPKEVVKCQSIFVDDILEIDVEKADNLGPVWGKFKSLLKKPTDQIMKEIDEGELDD